MRFAPLRRRTWLLAGVLAVLAVVWLCCHRQIEYRFSERLLLASKNPSEEFFEEMVKRSAAPAELLSRCWATGKITHRQLVASYLKETANGSPSWFAQAEPLLLAAALDEDMSVRELALATLAVRGDPRLFGCAQAQLDDVDPYVRLLGLEYLAKADAHQGVPVAMRLLDDPDLRVVARAEVALMQWSGEDYGVRSRLAIVSDQGTGADAIAPANAALIREGVARRKLWWAAHTNDFASNLSAPPAPRSGEPARPPAPDFRLKDLEGKPVRLSDFRGKPVLLNFWATWCTSCLAEIPELVALQNKSAGRFAIIGIALDGAEDEQNHTEGSQHRPGLKAVREKVRRAVTARRVNYPVLLDPGNSVGGQFNGGELPTTVLLDAQGRVRRRFIGERSLKVFEAMLAESAQPRK